MRQKEEVVEKSGRSEPMETKGLVPQKGLVKEKEAGWNEVGCKKQMGFYEILTNRTKNSREEMDAVNRPNRESKSMHGHTNTEQKAHTH